MVGNPRSVRCLGLVVLVGTLVLPLAAQNVPPVRVPPMTLTLLVRNASFLLGLMDRSRIEDSRELPLVS